MKKLLSLALVLVFAFVATVAFAADPPAAPAEKKYGQNVGDYIKPVELKSIDGKVSVKVDAVTKKSIFIMVSSVCTACRAELEDFKANADKIKERADVFVVIIDMDPAAAASRFGALPWPVLADSEYKLATAAGLGSAPSTLVVADGKILIAKSGYRADQWKEYVR